MGRILVAALGGSLIKLDDEESSSKWMKGLIELIMNLNEQGYRIGIVVGGGIAARQGINAVKSIITDSKYLDHIGISATRLNATLIQQAFNFSGIDVSVVACAFNVLLDMSGSILLLTISIVTLILALPGLGIES